MEETVDTFLLESWRDLFKSAFHWSVLLAVLIGLGFAALTATLESRSDLVLVSAAVFTVAGAIVALVVPAADLMGQANRSQADYWLKRVLEKQGPDRRKEAKNGAQSLQEIVEVSTPALRGSCYVFLSLVLSLFALCVPNAIILGIFLLDRVLLGLSIGLLLIGALWFFPAAARAYRLGTLEKVIRYLDLLADSPEDGET